MLRTGLIKIIHWSNYFCLFDTIISFMFYVNELLNEFQLCVNVHIFKEMSYSITKKLFINNEVKTWVYLIPCFKMFGQIMFFYFPQFNLNYIFLNFESQLKPYFLFEGKKHIIVIFVFPCHIKVDKVKSWKYMWVLIFKSKKQHKYFFKGPKYDICCLIYMQRQNSIHYS